MCHREIYWEKTASSETESEDESDGRGWWGVRAEDRRRGVVEEDATDDEREEDPVPADD